MRVMAVPVKSLDRAKSRLSPILSSSERAALSLAMLEDVLDACVAQAGWEVWLVSRDPAVLDTGGKWGARPVLEAGRSLRQAIRQVERAFPDPAGELAVVLADLPLLTAAALRLALRSATRGEVAAVAAESDGGTNMLVRKPAEVIPARFGRSSFARHRAEAYRAGVTFQEVRSAEVGFDLDRPADMARLLDSSAPGRARSACLEMGLPDRLVVRA